MHRSDTAKKDTAHPQCQEKNSKGTNGYTNNAINPNTVKLKKAQKQTGEKRNRKQKL